MDYIWGSSCIYRISAVGFFSSASLYFRDAVTSWAVTDATYKDVKSHTLLTPEKILIWAKNRTTIWNRLGLSYALFLQNIIVYLMYKGKITCFPFTSAVFVIIFQYLVCNIILIMYTFGMLSTSERTKFRVNRNLICLVFA